MRLKLLSTLSEEIKEQGYGRYYKDIELPDGSRIGDTRGYNFLDNKSIKKIDKKINSKVLSNSSTVTYNNSGLVTLSQYKTIYPLSIKGRKTSPFGPRNRKHHNGIDIGIPDGTGVNAVADGEVVRSDMSNRKGYGNFIIIKHSVDGETFYSAYAHLTKRLVDVSDNVKQGQKIAESGGGQGERLGAGNSRGPHLHFEIRKSENGDWVNPQPYLDGAGIVDGSADDTKDKEVNPEKEKEEKKEKEKEEKKNKHIVIGDSQTLSISSNNSKAKVISETQGKSSLWEERKRVSWLRDAVKKYPVSNYVLTVVINIGTNGVFDLGDDVDGLINAIKTTFPEAKLLAVKGSWGWSPYNKNVDEDDVNTYYEKFSKKGVTVLKTPIGKTDEHPGPKTPSFKEIGEEIESNID